MTNAEKLGLPALSFLINHGFFVALIIGWAITPGMMVVIGLVLESRWIPLFKRQFRAFMPGDLFLGVTFAAAASAAKQLPEGQHWWQSGTWHKLVLAGAVVGCLLARHFLDAPIYDHDQMWSPTKVYHDFVLYAGYGFILVAAGGPALLRLELGNGGGFRILGLTALLAWFGCLIYVQVFQDRRELAGSAHTADWRACWVK